MILHVWIVHVTHCDSEFRPLRIIAPDDIDKALEAAKEKMVRKFPTNETLQKRWPGPIHPDYRISGLMRSVELDDDSEET